MQIVTVAAPGDTLVESLRLIHRESLPDDITPNLTKATYKRIADLSARDGLLLVALEADQPVGFLFVLYRPEKLNQTLLASGADVAKCIGLLALTKPALLLDLLGSLVGTTKLDEPVAGIPEVYTICVAKAWRSRGLGSSLIAAAIGSLKEKGRILVKTSDARARGFYIREGFRQIGIQNRLCRRLAILKREF